MSSAQSPELIPQSRVFGASHQDLRLIIDSIPGLVSTMTADGEIEFVNQQVLDYLGKTLEELKAWASSDTVHPDDLPRVIEAWRNTVEVGQAHVVEHRLRRADGVYRWFDLRRLPQRNAEGRIIRWYNLLTYIEARKRTEDALRATEPNFRLIINNIPGLVCTMSALGEVEHWNRQVLEYFGKTAAELKNWGTSDAVHPDDLPRVIAAFKHSIETGTPYDIEHRCRRADGVYRWFQVRALPVQNPDGGTWGWYVLLTDIHERRQAEEKLRRNEWNLLEAQRLGHTGSWSLNIASGIVTTSPEMFREFDVKPGENTSSPDFWFSRIHPEDRKRVRDLFERCLVEKTDYEAEYRLLLPDGTIKHQHSIGYPVLGEAGDLLEYSARQLTPPNRYKPGSPWRRLSLRSRRLRTSFIGRT